MVTSHGPGGSGICCGVASSKGMGFRLYRRKSLGRGLWLGLSKSGVSGGRRGGRGSVSVNRRGLGGSLRVMKGLSYIVRRKR